MFWESGIRFRMMWKLKHCKTKRQKDKIRKLKKTNGKQAKMSKRQNYKKTKSCVLGESN